jgi:hypothetical protein
LFYHINSFQAPSVCVLLFCERKRSHTNTKQQAKLQILLQCYFFMTAHDNIHRGKTLIQIGKFARNQKFHIFRCILYFSLDKTQTQSLGKQCLYKKRVLVLYFNRYILRQEAKLKLNSVALVLKRTIPSERPPHVGEVSANFCG